MDSDLEAQVLVRFEERIKESSSISPETCRILSQDLETMHSSRDELVAKLVEEHRL